MDPQNANPSGQSPDGTFSNDNNTGVQAGVPTSNPAQSPMPDQAAPNPMPGNNPVNPEPVAQETPNIGAPASPVQNSAAPVFQQAEAVASSQGVSPSMPDQVMPGVVVGGVDQPMTQMQPTPMAAPAGTSGPKKRWMMPVVLVVALLAVLTGGYVFAVYIPNTPSAVYQTSLKESGAAIDKLINYSNSVSAKNYKSYTVNGSLNSSGTTSFSASVNGSGDTSGDAKFTLNADIMGEKLNANVDAVHISGSTTPDIYLQPTGVKPVLDSLGLSSLDGLDGKWISIDHTLISSALSGLNQSAADATKSTQQPTMAQIRDAVNKVQTVNKKYLFTTNTSTAILANEKYVGKSTLDGRSVYHYQVGYNKAHFESYLDAVASALDSSSLNTWSKLANNGQNLSQVLSMDSMKSSVDNGNASSRFDMWVDTKTKLPHTIQFVDPTDPTSAITFSQNYTGGTSYPFAFGFTGKNATNGDAEKAKIDFTIDTTTDKITAGFTATEGSDVNLNANLSVTPSMQAVQVTPPAGAQPVTSIMSQLGLGK